MTVLPVGTYKVAIEGQGFKRAVREDVAIEASVPRVLDTDLQVGEVAIEVNITDTAPLVTPTTSTTFRQLSGQELVDVPTSTRSFTHLLSSDAGVSSIFHRSLRMYGEYLAFSQRNSNDEYKSYF